jgi:hypothetical protein
MGLSLMNMLGFREVYVLHYTQVLCQYRLYRPDHAYFTYLMLQRQFSHLNGLKPLLYSSSTDCIENTDSHSSIIMNVPAAADKCLSAVA